MEQRGDAGEALAYRSIDKGVARLVRKARDAVVDNVLKAEALAEPILAGEVISVRTRRDKFELRLVARDDPEAAFGATLPISVRPAPEVGHLLRLDGLFRAVATNESIELSFAATGYHDPPQPASRLRRWAEEYARIHSDFPTPVEPSGPIRRIAILSGRDTHGLADTRAGVREVCRSYGVEVIEHHIPLESGTPEDTAAAIRAVLKRPGPIDVVAIVRGGGATERLLRFSNPVVVRAVAEVSSRIPTILGIGHERDHVAAEDFGWDVAHTPTAAGDKLAKLVRRMATAARPAGSPAHGVAAFQPRPVAVSSAPPPSAPAPSPVSQHGMTTSAEYVPNPRALAKAPAASTSTTATTATPKPIRAARRAMSIAITFVGGLAAIATLGAAVIGVLTLLHGDPQDRGSQPAIDAGAGPALVDTASPDGGPVVEGNGPARKKRPKKAAPVDAGVAAAAGTATPP